ncbi:hypothetical protein AYO20_09375 [Fonsecaea nubica]|uniref:Uncharacterized protein n=1 Tax=Fonsecaea nubica TaxID=856822 RepID=A0A178CIW3_9EURO|nr:hypothetical protein AYO20_09375 [Fonsecaea nubica]OAL28651.1 hypothetical protein AYO20_09375 [Fonsecaea nubica]
MSSSTLTTTPKPRASSIRGSATRPDSATLPDQPDEPIYADSMACARAFDRYMETYLLHLARVQSVDGRLLCLFQYSLRTWNDGVVAFRHDLVRTSYECEDWGDDEKYTIAILDAKYRSTHTDTSFLTTGYVNRGTDYLTTSSDGQIHAEAWSALQLQHRRLDSSVAQAIMSARDSDYDEPITTEKALRAIWPFGIYSQIQVQGPSYHVAVFTDQPSSSYREYTHPGRSTRGARLASLKGRCRFERTPAATVAVHDVASGTPIREIVSVAELRAASNPSS